MIYYEIEERNFYKVKQTPKTIMIDWIPQLNCDGSELDQNVRHKSLKVKKDNSGRHCLKQNDEDRILIYANRDGQPFNLIPAKLKHIEKEIEVCVECKIKLTNEEIKHYKVHTDEERICKDCYQKYLKEEKLKDDFISKGKTTI